MHLKYAELNKFTPVIDYKNYSNYYSGKSNKTSVNYWDYFWKQPTQFSLEDVYKSNNVILSSTNISKSLNEKYGYFDLNSIEFLENSSQLFEYHQIANQIRLNNSIKEKTDQDLKNVFGSKTNILGVSLRGTDYLNTNLAKGHFKPLTIEEALLLTEEILIEWKMDYVFVSTEVENYVDAFIQRFGKKILYLNRKRYNNSQSEKFITQYRFNRDNDRFETGLEYLREIYLLSECNSLFGTVSGGFNSAVILNNKSYQNFRIVDKGLIIDKGLT